MRFLSFLITVLIFLSSCSSSQKVAGTGFIQKRKYTSGFYVQKSLFNHRQKPSKGQQVSKNQVSTDVLEVLSTSEIVSADKQIPQVSINTLPNKSPKSQQNASTKVARITKPTVPSRKSKIQEEKTLRFIQQPLEQSKAVSLEGEEAKYSSLGTLSFFTSIFAWITLVGTLAVFFLGFGPIITAITLLGSLLFGIIGFFAGRASKDKVKAGDVGHDIALWYWAAWSVFIGTGLFGLLLIL